MGKKTFVLDTSAIMSLVQDVTTFRESPAFAGVLGDNDIVIPRVVLDELRTLRHAEGERATNALVAARQIEHYSAQGSLMDGVETEKGGILSIAPRPSSERICALGLNDQDPNHQILGTAIELDDQKAAQSRDCHGENGESSVILITQDSILRVLARSLYGVVAEELKSVCAPDVGEEPGYHKMLVDGDTVDRAIADGGFDCDVLPRVNEFVHLVNKDNPNVHYCYGIAREVGSKSVELIDRASVDFLKVAGDITGRNVRQKLLLWTLMGCGESDPMASDGVRLITVSGPAGSGKSFLTLAAAWERLERGHFDRIVLTRPMVNVGREIGFLPGTLDEKIRPWGGPVEDNLRAIVQVPSPDEGRGGGAKRGLHRAARPFDAKAWLEMEDRLEIAPLTYIRGRTFRRSVVILEEAQNLERGPLKVLLTRLGEGSIVVVIGDRSQIDNQFLSPRNNGLIHAINAFRDWPQAVHLHLRKIVRSDLADAATKLL